MRPLGITLSALLLLAPLTLAQQGAPPAQPQQPQFDQDKMLDFVLGNWEQSMTKLDSFSAACVRTTTDKTFGTTEVYEGWAKFLKSGPKLPSKAVLELAKKNQPEKFEKYLCNGNFLYIFAPSTKVIHRHELPQNKAGQVGEENFLTFLFGMKAAEAKQRYQMTFVPDAKDQNRWYYYLKILPRTQQDKADFTEARLVLTSKDFMPRQLWYHQPNGNEITWDFPKVEINAPLAEQTFELPKQLPAGWRLEVAQPPMQAQPPVPAQPTSGAQFPAGKK